MTRTLGTLLLIAVLLSACAESTSLRPATPGAAVSGEVSKPGAMLAYAHEVGFEVAPDSMAARIAAVQSACNEERFGTCSVLGIEQNTGDYARASIRLRVVPAGVEPLIALAADGSELAERKTSAEDLADAVADVAAQRDLLQRERQTLQGYVERKDLSVSDLITLSQRLAAVESSLHQLAQEAANQRRRLESNHLRIELRSNVPYDDRSNYSFADLWDLMYESLLDGLFSVVEYGAYLLPLVLLIFPFALAWRWAWRKATGSARRQST